MFLLQQRVAELELQFSDLEKENTEVQKNLKDCHVLLVSAKIDPGEYVAQFFLCVFVGLLSVQAWKWHQISVILSFRRKSWRSCTTKWRSKKRSHGTYSALFQFAWCYMYSPCFIFHMLCQTFKLTQITTNMHLLYVT